MLHEHVGRGWRDRFSSALDRAEGIYLRILRAVILVIATLMIGFAIWLAVSSVYKMSRSPESVTEEQASVAADEITNAEMPAKKQVVAQANAEPVASPEQQRFYREFVNRYYDLYRTRFEPFRQSEDKELTRDEFDDSFISSQARLEQVAKGDLDFEADRADLNSLLAVMTEASERPVTRERLQRYKVARKVRVEQTVQRTRTEYRQGWDNYSTACADWYYSPVGCPVRRAVQVPYTETVASLEFPKGTQSHIDIFRAFQQRYFDLLGERRESSAQKAEDERQGIIAGKLEGELSLMTALQVVGAFLALMFFFLLIAIERHQRRMAERIEENAVSAYASE